MFEKTKAYDPVTAHVPGVDEPTHQEELAAYRSAGDPRPPRTKEEVPKKKSKFLQGLEKIGIKIS